MKILSQKLLNFLIESENETESVRNSYNCSIGIHGGRRKHKMILFYSEFNRLHK